MLNLQDEHDKFKKSWLLEKQKIQQRCKDEDLFLGTMFDGTKKNQNRGKSEDYRILCGKLMEAKKKTANLVN